VARALPIWDRELLGESGTDTADADRRMRRWRRVLGGRGPLARRLGAMSIDDALPMLADPPPAVDAAALPEWAQTLAAALGAASGAARAPGSAGGGDASAPGEQTLPFEPVFAPFLAAAVARLQREAGPALCVLGPAARHGFERQLIAHLAFVASLTLAEDFSNFRFERAPASAFEAQWRDLPPSTRVYDAYVASLLDGGLEELFGKRPVLGRLLSQSANQWSRATASLCRRFRRDFPLLRETFGWTTASPAGAIEAVRTDLSDRHNGGRTVAELIVKGGARIIYKPRTVQAEWVFNEFLQWLNAGNLNLQLRTLITVDRGGYGWCEAAAPAACASAAGLGRYYARAGMLLAVLDALAVTDIHCENIIAAGEHPVVVDLETLLTGSTQGGGRRSLLDIGLLPRWQVAPDGHRFDMSGLAADETSDAGIERRAWRRLNTDQMYLSDSAQVGASMAHRPWFADRAPDVVEHLPDFVAGFGEMYAHLRRRRDELLGNSMIMSMFDGLELRVLLRGTTTYTGLQLRLLHPEFMAGGIERSIELEWLARPLTGPQAFKDGRLRIYAHELAAMEMLDVPHFTNRLAAEIAAASDDPDLAFLRGPRDGSVLRERLENLAPRACARHVRTIEKAIRDRYAPTPDRNGKASGKGSAAGRRAARVTAT
jgi:type 2 lantibiotic biosynthesis protein LanM